MKSLALLRHAKSSWETPGVTDFERPLKRRGREAAAAIGMEMRRCGLAFDTVIASPARRVVETIAHLEEGYGEPLRPRFDERIYHGSSRLLLAILQGVEEPALRVLVVGHSRGLPGLANLLARKDGEGLYRRVADHYPTAALTLLTLDAERWCDVGPEGGVIEAYLKPRELPGAP